MKPQSKLVQQIKGKIQSMLKLIALGVKKYVVKLLELEQKLKVVMSKQLETTLKTAKAFKVEIEQSSLRLLGNLQTVKSNLMFNHCFTKEQIATAIFTPLNDDEAKKLEAEYIADIDRL